MTLPSRVFRSARCAEVFLLGGTPCVMVDGKRGGVAVAALTEAIA
jgi:hypothetical protein